MIYCATDWGKNPHDISNWISHTFIYDSPFISIAGYTDLTDKIKAFSMVKNTYHVKIGCEDTPPSVIHIYFNMLDGIIPLIVNHIDECAAGRLSLKSINEKQAASMKVEIRAKTTPEALSKLIMMYK